MSTALCGRSRLAGPTFRKPREIGQIAYKSAFTSLAEEEDSVLERVPALAEVPVLRVAHLVLALVAARRLCLPIHLSFLSDSSNLLRICLGRLGAFSYPGYDGAAPLDEPNICVSA